MPLSDSEPSNRFRIPNPASLLVVFAAALGLATPARGEVKRLTFPVSGLHSPLATRGIEEAIRTLPGVASVAADLGSGRVDVQAEDQKSLNIQDVRTRAARAGFPVSGDLDVEARGRFEIGTERRITFKVSGTTYAWQVLESGTLLDLFRAYPTLRGDFVTGFRLHDGAAWSKPAITLTGWHLIPAPALPGRPAPPKPHPQTPAPAKTAAATKAAPAKPAPGKTVAAKSGSSKPAPAKTASAKTPDRLTRKERRELKKQQEQSDTRKAEPQRP